MAKLIEVGRLDVEIVEMENDDEFEFDLILWKWVKKMAAEGAMRLMAYRVEREA